MTLAGLTDAAAFERVRSAVVHAVEWEHVALDAIGAAVVAIGAGILVVRLAGRLIRRDTTRLTGVRLGLARFLTLALELQLAADVVATAIAPTWQEIGQLAAIALIRTALNYSLTREIANERKEIADEREGRKSNMSAAIP